jgi:hypothetical protein
VEIDILDFDVSFPWKPIKKERKDCLTFSQDEIEI